ncbi:polyprenyl synthetase family protein [Alphaproteobacteria bacterium]|nr:polyprenyl synthetase family protein [Alphaproteobacteria bacterium]
MSKIIKLVEERNKRPSALDILTEYISDDLKLVNKIIIQEMQSKVSLIPTLAGHIVVSGGKRIRPILTLASAKLCNYEGERQIKLAACVEFIHTATLLHDDVVDSSILRRGVNTANAIWGNEASVLVGDFLFSRSFQLMVDDSSLSVLRILSKASAIIAEGEVHQLLTTNNTSTGEDSYLEVISAKTAALFSAACRIGAVIADRPNADEEALAGFGNNLGIAFQLVDDALDYSSKSRDIGKSIGDDFKEGKITLPLILAYRRGDENERSFWHRTINEGNQNEKDVDTAIALMKKHNTILDTIKRAQHYGEKAKDALAIFPDSKIKNILMDLVDFCIKRNH